MNWIEELVQPEQPTCEDRRQGIGDALVKLGRRKDIMILYRSDLDREDEDEDHADGEPPAHGSAEREHEVEHLGAEDCDADDVVEDERLRRSTLPHEPKNEVFLVLNRTEKEID